MTTILSGQFYLKSNQILQYAYLISDDKEFTATVKWYKEDTSERAQIPECSSTERECRNKAI